MVRILSDQDANSDWGWRMKPAVALAFLEAAVTITMTSLASMPRQTRTGILSTKRDSGTGLVHTKSDNGTGLVRTLVRTKCNNGTGSLVLNQTMGQDP